MDRCTKLCTNTRRRSAVGYEVIPLLFRCSWRGRVTNQHLEQEGDISRDSADAMREWENESRAREKLKRIWQPGDLFHIFSRYPRRPRALKVDRLAGVLKKGIVPPASCNDGSVCSDLNLVVIGLSVPYDSLVFLHQFGPQSAPYTIAEPGRLAVFIDPAMSVLTPEDMGPDWVVLCQDEVYVRGRVAREHFIGVAVHPVDADTVMEEFLLDFKRLGIPLYLYDGTAVWP